MKDANTTLEIALDNAETLLAINALDLYLRIWIGQYGELRLCTGYALGVFGDTPIERRAESMLVEVRRMVLPQIPFDNLNGNLGIWSDATDRRAICAYDMIQVMRYARSSHLHPEGGGTVDFRTPMIEGCLPTVECACAGNIPDDFSMEVGMSALNAALAAEALEMSDLCLRGKIGDMFVHYTDDEKAIGLTRRVEPLLSEIPESATWTAFGQSNPSIPALRERIVALDGVAEAIETMRHGKWGSGPMRGT